MDELLFSKKYYVRKTFIYNGYIFGDEELFAYPLK